MPIERHFSIDPRYSLDNYFRLHFRSGAILEPCEPIAHTDFVIAVVDNNHLSAKRLLLVPKDREPIRITLPETQEEKMLPHPGKSAFIFLGERQDTATMVRSFVNRLVGGQADRRDHLHATTVGQITEVGWQVWWAPLQMQGNLMHVRIICNSTIHSGQEPTIDDATRLMNVFRKLESV